MSTTATPPASTPPPAAPVAPTPVAPAKVAPSTPPIPAAQSGSVKNAPANKTATTSSRTPPEAPPTLDNEMRKLAEEHFKPKEPKPAEPAAVVPPISETAKPKEPAPPIAAEKEPLDIPEPKGMTPENLANWKTWREQAKAEINAAKNERAALAEKLKVYEKATPADTEKATRLEAQLKEMQDKLAVYDVKSTPDYIRQFVEPKHNALKEATEIIGYQNEPKQVDLSKLLDKPLKDFNAEVSSITEGMNGMDAQNVQAALRQAYKIQNDEKGALSNASQLKSQIEAKAAKAARDAFDQIRGELKTKVPEMVVPEGATPEKIAEIESYNAAVQAAMQEAENYSFGKIDEKEVARISHQAAMLKPVAQHLIPALQRDLQKSNELVKALSSELAAIKRGKNPGNFNETSAPAKADTSKMSFQELYDHTVASRTAK